MIEAHNFMNGMVCAGYYGELKTEWRTEQNKKRLRTK